MNTSGSKVIGSIAAVAAMVIGMAAAPSAAQAAAHHSSAPSAKTLRAVRAKERRMAASSPDTTPKPATPAAVFTVNTTADTLPANPTGTTCVDTGGKCSLRTAIAAANSLAKPVEIVVPAGSYTLTQGLMTVTNPGGTDILGAGSSKSVIKGSGSAGLFVVTAASGEPGGLLFINGAELTGGNTADGGAITLSNAVGGGTAVLTNDVLTKNTATNAGGAIYATDYDTLYMDNVTVSDNTAPSGGAVYAYWLDGHIVDSRFTGNTASAGAGGAFYIEYGVVDLKGGSISDNTAGTAVIQGEGGAVYQTYGDVELDGVTVNGNVADDTGSGGAFYLSYAMLDATAGTISDDSTTSGVDGGAVYGYDGVQLGLHGVTMADDTLGGTPTTAEGGGAIYLLGDKYPVQLTIDSGSTITGAKASAIYFEDNSGGSDVLIDDSTLSGNDDAYSNSFGGYGCGGAVCDNMDTDSGSSLTMSGDTVSDNSGVGNYGAGAVSVWAGDNGSTTTTLDDDTFSANTAGDHGYGGAVGIYNEANSSTMSVRTASDVFKENRVGGTSAGEEGFGGGMAVFDEADVTDVGSVFSGNKALGNSAQGGGLYLHSSWTSRLSKTRILDNDAGSTSDSGTGGFGGGLYLDEEGGDHLDHVVVSGNFASQYGGGIFADSNSYDVDLSDSTVSGNTAGSSSLPGYGGGLYLDDAVGRITESTVANNKALSVSGSPGYGGGVEESGSHFGVRYSTISGNVGTDGGGIYTDGEGGTLLSSIVSANHSSTGAEQDCSNASTTTALDSLGGNVLGTGGCAAAADTGDVSTSSPGLRALGSYGGPTKTMALTSTSPARTSGTLFCDSTDQRGHSRPSSKCSAGAYQWSPGTVSSVTPAKGKAGTKVTIHGSGFQFLAKVVFGSHAAKIVSSSATTVVVTAPAGPKGLKKKAHKVAVEVFTPDGHGTAGHFTYPKLPSKKHHKKHKG